MAGRLEVLALNRERAIDPIVVGHPTASYSVSGLATRQRRQMSDTTAIPRLPPHRFIRMAWLTHRGLYRLTGGRLGIWKPKPNGWGALRLTTVGRRTGLERSVMVGYIEDGANLVTMAMNGWSDWEPAWWLNLQAQPNVRVDLVGGSRLVTGRVASGEERERLWSRWRDVGKNLDAYARRRSMETAIVVLEPRT